MMLRLLTQCYATAAVSALALAGVWQRPDIPFSSVPLLPFTFPFSVFVAARDYLMAQPSYATIPALLFVWWFVAERYKQASISSSASLLDTIHPFSLNPKPVTSDVKFADVIGCDESKSELEECVLFLQQPEVFTSLGARLPRGVLLLGPPGVGALR